jgi:hypothetical protein
MDLAHRKHNRGAVGLSLTARRPLYIFQWLSRCGRLMPSDRARQDATARDIEPGDPFLPVMGDIE